VRVLVAVTAEVAVPVLVMVGVRVSVAVGVVGVCDDVAVGDEVRVRVSVGVGVVVAVGVEMGVRGLVTCLQTENSEVFPLGSVAVPVMNCPTARAGVAMLNDALPSVSVRVVAPDPR